MEGADRHVFFSKHTRECDVLSGAATEGKCFLRVPQKQREKTEGNNDFLSSRSPSVSSQRPEPTSSQIFIWVSP